MMNAKIEKFVKKAGIDIRGIEQCHDEDIESQLQMFARLLIDECAKVADDGYGSANFGNGITSAMLKNHFGVE